MRKILDAAKKEGYVKYIKNQLLSNSSTQQTVIKNTFWLFVAEGFNKISLFIVSILLARFLGVDKYGIYSFALAFVGIFSIISDFGLGTLLIREVARDLKKAQLYLSNVSYMKIILGVANLGIVILIAQFLGKSGDVNTIIYLAAIYTTINTFNEFFRSTFRAFEQMEYEAYAKIANGFVLLGIIGYAILTKSDLFTILMGYIITSLIQLVFVIFLVRKDFSSVKLKIDFTFMKQVLGEAWPLALSGIFVSVYMWTDTVMLSLMKTDEVVGIYSAAYRIVFSLAIIPLLIMSGLYPKMSRANVTSKKRLGDAYSMSLKVIGLLAIIIFPILFLLSGFIINILYGKAFEQSIIAFQILLWAEFFAYFSQVFLFTLNSINKQKLYTLAVGLSVIANLILNLLLIPKYSYIGASIATVLTEGMSCILLWHYISREMKNEIS